MPDNTTVSQEDMIEALVEDMKTWSHECLLDWAQYERRQNLEASDTDDVKEEYEEFLNS